MSVKIYSLKKDGENYLSKNFKVREFACNDGSDEIKIDTQLVAYLQNIRNMFGRPVIINSAYRTPAYNVKVGGAKNSYHVKGMAADIRIVGVLPKRVAAYAEAIGIKGVGWYEAKNFCHIDTRSNRYFWKDKSGNSLKTFSDCPYTEPSTNLRTGDKSSGVKWLQWHLNKIGYKHIEIDGAFGAQTKLAVKDFQTKCGLESDGIAGAKTRTELKKEAA